MERPTLFNIDFYSQTIIPAVPRKCLTATGMMVMWSVDINLEFLSLNSKFFASTARSAGGGFLRPRGATACSEMLGSGTTRYSGS